MKFSQNLSGLVKGEALYTPLRAGVVGILRKFQKIQFVVQANK